MIQHRKHLIDIVNTMVSERESYHDFSLNATDREFLVESLVDFLHESIDKYILGAREHNADNEETFVYGVDHLREINNEVIDQFFYSRAHKWQVRKQKL